MISADPTLRQMAASNPALGAMLADPELMRRMMDPQNMQVCAWRCINSIVFMKS
jgi:hypothetical protein